MKETVDMEKVRREEARWYILVTLNAARPIGASERIILSALETIIPDFTQRELRLELDYLQTRKLVEVGGKDAPTWFAKLTRQGVDVVEYTSNVEPGIARPRKYW